MKIKISKERFNQILKEEVDKYKKIKELESDKKTIEEALLKLETASSKEEIDELWGGIKNLINKGAGAVASGVKNSVKAAGQDIKNAWNDASQSVNQGVDTIKKTYQQGERIAAKKKAENQINKIYSQIKATQKQLQDLNKQYFNMTGLNFNPKAIAGPKDFVKRKQPQPQVQPQQQANVSQAAE